jgi:structural maintenance of chromosome 1
MSSQTHLSLGLVRLRDNLVAQLQELNRSKPRGKADENVIAEITRLESAIAVVRDDLVRSRNNYWWHYNSLIVLSGI